MNNWKVIFATVVIFGAGVLTGGLLVNYVQHSELKPPRKFMPAAEARPRGTNAAPHLVDNSKSRPPEILSKPFLQKLTEDLHLKPDQHEAVEKIINDGQNQIRKAIQDARLEIRELLTQAQRKQFDELIKRPFHKPIFGTNGAPNAASPPSSFQTRLEQIIAKQRMNPESPSNSPLAPEAQVLWLEAQRAKMLDAGKTNLLPPLPPPPLVPPVPTNAP